MKSSYSSYRITLNSLQSSHAKRFLFSIAIGLVVMAVASAVFTRFVFPSLLPTGAPVQVISSPSTEQTEVPSTTKRVPTARPLPQPPSKIPTLSPMAMPSEPLLVVPASLDNAQLLTQAEEALLVIELFEKEEVKRLEELQEKVAAEAALTAQKNQAEEEVERERKEKARQLAAQREEEQKRAAAAQANRIASTPTIEQRTPPVYPTISRRKKEEGTTRIAVTITSIGTVASPRITTSSGHRSLDSSALAAVETWRFNPAKNGLGQPVSFRMTIPVKFRLR